MERTRQVGAISARDGSRLDGGPQRRTRSAPARAPGDGPALRGNRAGGGRVTLRQCRRRLVGLGLLAGVTGGSLLHGGPNLLLVALLVGAAGLVAYQIWRPWAGARCWVRVRYHSATPPDPAAMQEGLLALLDWEALVVRWIREPEGVSLWLEIPA